ncbi:hypothetical protein MSAN_02314800 [Mycena sanguinolenta]|uniref:Uncharacterized protein n=1 Tax=Mycena sanguinolenta TaxID=230812 RepID=A0A8H7CH01_9AGAR|nr:hypothetical protein MSAN_02314800 [Mycena sanguinolenta]
MEAMTSAPIGTRTRSTATAGAAAGGVAPAPPLSPATAALVAKRAKPAAAERAPAGNAGLEEGMEVEKRGKSSASPNATARRRGSAGMGLMGDVIPSPLVVIPPCSAFAFALEAWKLGAATDVHSRQRITIMRKNDVDDEQSTLSVIFIFEDQSFWTAGICWNSNRARLGDVYLGKIAAD